MASSTSTGRKPNWVRRSGRNRTAMRGAPGGDFTFTSACPGTELSTLATSSALASSRSRSGPKFSAEERHPCGCAQADHHHGPDDQPGPAREKAEHAAVAGLEPALQAGFLGLAHAFVKEEIGKRRRERERDQQRGHDGQNV